MLDAYDLKCIYSDFFLNPIISCIAFSTFFFVNKYFFWRRNCQILMFRFVNNSLYVYNLSGIWKNGGLARNYGFSQEILEINELHALWVIRNVVKNGLVFMLIFCAVVSYFLWWVWSSRFLVLVDFDEKYLVIFYYVWHKKV